MLMDSENEFSDSQAVTTDAISEDVLDLGDDNTQSDIGMGAQQVYLVVQCDVTADSAGDGATLIVSLESDSTENLATSATVHWTSKTFTQAECVAGATLAVIPVPPGDYERYLGVRYNNGTEAFTAGKFSAFLTTDIQRWKSYADAVDKILEDV